MAIYATVGDVREALAPEGNFNDPSTAASLGDPQLTDALTEASSEIDGRVKGAPFSGTPSPVIQGITRDIAAYLASLTHRKGVELPERHPVALRYQRAQNLLAAAEKGALDFSDTTESDAGEVVAVNRYDGDLFTLEDFDLGVEERFLPPWLGGRASGW
jgi:hypothetical protein